MHHVVNVSMAAAVLLLAGCASTPATPPVAPPASAAPTIAALGADDELMTGSRIPKRKSTDRMLHTIGAKEAADTLGKSYRPLDSSREY